MKTKQRLRKMWMIGFLLFFGILSSFAQKLHPERVPAMSRLLEVVQPNGYKLRIYLCGDEYLSWRMTADGHMLLVDKKGFYCYACETCSGKVKPSIHKAKNEEDRTAIERRFLEKQAKNSKLNFCISKDEN